MSLDTGGPRVGENNRVEIHLQVGWVWGQEEREGGKNCRNKMRFFYMMGIEKAMEKFKVLSDVQEIDSVELEERRGRLTLTIVTRKGTCAVPGLEPLLLKMGKGNLLFSSVELLNFGVGRWLRSSTKMHHILGAIEV